MLICPFINELFCYDTVKLSSLPTHFVTCVRNVLVVHRPPLLRLIILTHFQDVPTDGALALVQRSLPQQHQGVVSHLLDLQVKRAT